LRNQASEYTTAANENFPITTRDKFDVGILILEQMRTLLTRYGIVILDRNGGNMIITHNQGDDSKNRWNVKHIDLALAYDAVEDTSLYQIRLI